MRNVHLVDGSENVGGHLRWLTTLPGLNEWNRVVEHRMIQLGKLSNVEVIRGQRMSAQDIAEYGAGIVILASGSHWSRNGVGPVTRHGLPGADASLPWILTPEQILAEGKEVPGERVVIIDQDGYHVAAGLADRLSSEGKKVTVVTHQTEFAPYTHFTLESTPMRRKLHAQGVTFMTTTIPTRCGPEGVYGHYAYASADEEQLFAADAVVLVTQRVSDTSLYRSLTDDWGAERLLAEDVHSVYRIGDCVAPRIVAESVFDGHRLAREIDSPDPSMPLPYLRERAVEVRIERRPPVTV